jgi:hypothetical protein
METYDRRRLPHVSEIGKPLFLTWRLFGSLPAGQVYQTKMESGKAFVAMDRFLDTASVGPTYLRRREIAELVADSIRYGETEMGR